MILQSCSFSIIYMVCFGSTAFFRSMKWKTNGDKLIAFKFLLNLAFLSHIHIVLVHHSTEGSSFMSSSLDILLCSTNYTNATFGVPINQYQ